MISATASLPKHFVELLSSPATESRDAAILSMTEEDLGLTLPFFEWINMRFSWAKANDTLIGRIIDQYPLHNHLIASLAMKSCHIALKILLKKQVITEEHIAYIFNHYPEIANNLFIKSVERNEVALTKKILQGCPKLEKHRLYHLKNCFQRTPFQEAISNENDKMVRILLEECPPKLKLTILAPNNGGNTPLHFIAKGHGEEMIHAVLENCPKNVQEIVFGKNEGGMTPLNIAVTRGDVSIVNALLERCHAEIIPKLFLPNENRRTILHAAAFYGKPSVIKTLLNYCPVPMIPFFYAKDNMNLSPFSIQNGSKNNNPRAAIELLKGCPLEVRKEHIPSIVMMVYSFARKNTFAEAKILMNNLISDERNRIPILLEISKYSRLVHMLLKEHSTVAENFLQEVGEENVKGLPLKHKLAILPLLPPNMVQELTLTIDRNILRREIQADKSVRFRFDTALSLVWEQWGRHIRWDAETELNPIQDYIKIFLNKISFTILAKAAADEILQPLVCRYIRLLSEPQAAVVIPNLSAESFVEAMHEMKSIEKQRCYLPYATLEQKHALLATTSLLPQRFATWEADYEALEQGIQRLHDKEPSDAAAQQYSRLTSLITSLSLAIKQFQDLEKKRIEGAYRKGDFSPELQAILEGKIWEAETKLNTIDDHVIIFQQKIYNIKSKFEFVIPEHFLDPITNELMTDPVQFPSCENIMDRSTATSQRVEGRIQNPFNRQLCDESALTPLPALKAAIDEWKNSSLDA